MKIKLECKLEIEKEFENGTYCNVLFFGGSFKAYTADEVSTELKEREFTFSIIDGNKFKARF